MGISKTTVYGHILSINIWPTHKYKGRGINEMPAKILIKYNDYIIGLKQCKHCKNVNEIMTQTGIS